MLETTATPTPEPGRSREVAARRRLPRALTPFAIPAYRRLALALVLTTFASGVWVIGLVWEVIRIGGGPAELSVVTTASAIGVLLPSLLGGVVADRVAQKLILLAVAGVELAGMAMVATLSLTDTTQLWHLAAVSFVTGSGMAFYYPAYSAWLPALVPESDLMAVNGFEGMVRPTIGQAVGPAVAGAVVGMASSGAAVLVAAVVSFAGLCALTAVPKTPVRRQLGRRHRRAPDRDGDARHARRVRLHAPYAMAARDTAVRIADDLGDHGTDRGSRPVLAQGPTRRRPR